MCSVTRWLDCFLIFGPFTTIKIDPIAKLVVKVVSKYYHFAPTFLKFCQSGEISPNLVTMLHLFVYIKYPTLTTFEEFHPYLLLLMQKFKIAKSQI